MLKEMVRLQEEFNKQYDFMYESSRKNIYVSGTDEAIDYFDSQLTDTEKSILKEFILYRGDFLTSDREVVSFMFAIDNLY